MTDASPPRSLPLVALALAAAVLVLQARVVIGGQTWDDVAYHTEVAPPRLAAAAQVHAGQLPAWWDGTGLGVPLAAEPSHGAAYPPTWLAATPRALDLAIVVHLLALALGVALWARRRASDTGALIAGVFAATTGIAASCALRGALPALAYLPWIGWAASGLADASDRRTRARWAAGVGALVGAIALAGQLAMVVDAIALAAVVGARRDTWRWLAGGVAAGLAIGAALWLPVFAVLGAGAGASARAIPIVRVVELIVPVCLGGDRAAHVPALADLGSAAPTLYVGVPVIALALVRGAGRPVARLAAALGVVAVIAGRGSWPAWLGAPELHVAALAVIAAVHAAAGVDALLAGERRARLALWYGAIALALALAALGGLRSDDATLAPVLDGALLAGGLGLACTVAAVVLARPRDGRPWRAPVVLALVVAPGVLATPVVAPVVARAEVTERPAWVAAAGALPVPRRVFRQARLGKGPDTLADALASFGGTSGARWGFSAAPGADPARPAVADATWLAASAQGRELLDRFGIALAVLPAGGRPPGTSLGTRGRSELVQLAGVTAPAAVYASWEWVADDAAAIARLFPEGGGARGGHDRVVLAGKGIDNEEGVGVPAACEIARWIDGAIDLDCTAPAAAYAVVSSSAGAGWSATVDGREVPWVRADMLRRAVVLPAGRHRVAWRYRMPGLPAGGALAVLGLLGLAALVALGRRTRR